MIIIYHKYAYLPLNFALFFVYRDVLGASIPGQKQAPRSTFRPCDYSRSHSLVNSLDAAGKTHMQGVWGPDDSEHMYTHQCMSK